MGAVKEWMTTLENKMKQTLKEIYKKGSMVANTIISNSGIDNSNKSTKLSSNDKVSKDKLKTQQSQVINSPSLPTYFHNESLNYPLQLVIIDEFVWFTKAT